MLREHHPDGPAFPGYSSPLQTRKQAVLLLAMVASVHEPLAEGHGALKVRYIQGLPGPHRVRMGRQLLQDTQDYLVLADELLC